MDASSVPPSKIMTLVSTGTTATTAARSQITVASMGTSGLAARRLTGLGGGPSSMVMTAP